MSMDWVPLGEHLVQRGDSELVVPGSHYPIAGVLGFGRGMLHRPAIDGSETAYKSLLAVASGNLVYSKVKAFEGAVAVATPADAGRYVSPEFPVFQGDEGLSPAYLRHAVSSEFFLAGLRSSSSGIGARRERVHPTTFLRQRIPVPPLDEQLRIAAHLDSIGALARKRRSTATFATAWTVALRDRVVEGTGGELTSLAHLLRARPATPVSDQETYRITGVYSFGRGLLDRGPLSGDKTKYAAMTTLHQGDVVYSKLGAFEDAVAVVDDSFTGTQVSPEFPVFEVVADLDPVYLRAALTTTSFHEALKHAATGVGARQRRVSPSAFLSLKIPVPPLQRQQAAAVVLSRAAEIGRLDGRAQTLTGALLPAARNEIFSAMR